MSFGSPWMLLLLAVVPLLVRRLRGGRCAGARRRAARLASEGLVPTTARRGACGGATSRSRSSPPAIALVVFALARPTVNLPVPQREGTVILAFDVSNSMRAKDLAADPDRGGQGGRPRVRRDSSRARSRSASSRSATAPSPCSSRATTRPTCSRRSTGSRSAAARRSARASSPRSARSPASR